MRANRLKAWLKALIERLMYNPLSDRVKEATELWERYESIQNKIRNYQNDKA